jgi:hypothetical protein
MMHNGGRNLLLCLVYLSSMQLVIGFWKYEGAIASGMTEYMIDYTWGDF